MLGICGYFCVVGVCYFGLWWGNLIFNWMGSKEEYKEMVKIVLNSGVEM